MANAFLKPTVIVNTALGMLQRELVLPRIVFSDARIDFRGAKNDTVTIRLGAIATARDYEFRTRTAPITVDDLTETSVDVKLDKHPLSAVAITDEELTLDIGDFGMQVLQPQIRAVAERMEGYVATTLSGATYGTTVAYDEATGSAWKTAVAARKALNLANVPLADRFLVLGADVEEAYLNDDKFVKANEAGTDSALREAVLGRIAGFTVVSSNAIGATEAYAMHRTAVAMANVAPAVPAGASAGAGASYQGLAMRWIRDYDPNYARDRSVVSAFAGTAPVMDNGASVVRAVKIAFTPAP